MESHLRRTQINTLWRYKKRRGGDQRPSPKAKRQEMALQRIMETDYAPTDLSVKRREYEINMLLLFRDVQNKHFQKQLPMNLDLHHLDSYKRLVAFVNNIPARDEKYQASRRRFTKEKGFFSEERGNYLTELAVYWRSRPDKVEMMEYKEVWEVVAQRPLAWELLPPGWQPSVTNERRSTITRDSTAKHRLQIPDRDEATTTSSTMTTSRILPSALRAFSRPATRAVPLSRTFKMSSTLLDSAAAAIPIRKPVGAFRGGMFGFLLGTTLAGASAFYYIIDEYRVSNELLTEDIYALQAAVRSIPNYVEERLDELKKEKK
ncbi:hypothetical protein Q9189_007720 [Teloschistes chrysophthalmus]